MMEGFEEEQVSESDEAEASDSDAAAHDSFEDASERDYGAAAVASASSSGNAAARSQYTLDEDTSLLSEDELRERVRRSIEALVPDGTAASGPTSFVSDDGDAADLTPAQLFYLENRDSLINRAQDYYVQKQQEQLQASDDVEEEWRYYHDPVVRPVKGHLWSTGEGTEGEEEPSLEYGYLSAVSNWPRGALPGVELIVDLLRREQAKDVHVVDLHACGRHDIGTHAIIATGVTTTHNRRLGEVAAKATQMCHAPHVEAFCYGTRNDEWVVAHCGPMKVHVFTREARAEYNLETLYERPGEFFEEGDFPHYLDWGGMSATDVDTQHVGMISSGGSPGTRSKSLSFAPFRDELQRQLQEYDYEAADDSRYVGESSTALSSNVDDSRYVGESSSAWARHADSAGTGQVPAEPVRIGTGLSRESSSNAGGESDTDDEGAAADVWPSSKPSR